MNTKLLAVAGLLTALSLSLPWRAAAAGIPEYGTYTPGMCITRDPWNNPTYDCDVGYYTAGAVELGLGAAVGWALPIRIFAAAAVVLLALAWRSQRRHFGVSALIVATAGLALSDGWGQPGMVLFVASILVAARGLGMMRRAQLPITVTSGVT